MLRLAAGNWARRLLLRRGAVVLFRYPTDASSILIKRVIALEGDVLPGAWCPVPEGHVFVEGDANRGGRARFLTGDSWSYGPVPLDRLLGIALIRAYPRPGALARLPGVTGGQLPRQAAGLAGQLPPPPFHLSC